MKTKKNYIISSKSLLFLTLLNIFINIQIINGQSPCNSTILKEASDNYIMGNFNFIQEVSECLENGLRNKQERIAALRILSLTNYATDDLKKSEEFATKIINEDQAFTPNVFDPDFFKKAINKARRNSASNVVTSVSKKAENIDLAPATVAVINENIIKRRGYNDLEALIHDLPGFDISRSNGLLYSNIYQRGYRSSNTNRTLLMFDGIEENDLWSFNVFLSRQYALSNVKNVEVVYGPTSTIYGANAYLGVINVTTKNPVDFIEEGNIFGVEAHAGYGTYNTKYIDASVAVRAKNLPIAFSVTSRIFRSAEQDLSGFENWDFKNNFSEQDYIDKLSISGNGKSFFTAINNAASPYYQVVVNGSDTTAVALTQAGAKKAKEIDDTYYNNPQTRFVDDTKSWAINSKLRLFDLLIGYYAWGKNESAGAWYNDIRQGGGAYDEIWSPRHQSIFLKYNKTVTPNISISNFLRYKIHDFDKDTKLVGIRTYMNGRLSFDKLITDAPVRIDNLYFYQISKQLRNELKILYLPLDNFDVVSGIETRFSSVQGDYVNSIVDNPEENGNILLSQLPAGGNHFNSLDIGVFTQISYKPIDIISLTGGLRFDYNRIRRNGGYGSVFNPRASVVIAPGNFVFKAIYSSAFLDANSRERFSTVAGQRELPNSGLKPERVKNFEFSVGGKFLDSKLKIDISIYRAKYDNIIQTIQVPFNGNFTGQNNNIGEQRVIGIQSNVKYNWNNLEIYANYTNTNSFVINPVNSNREPILDANGIPIKELKVGDIANHQINFGANYLFFDKLNLNLRGNLQGKREVGANTNVPNNPGTFNPYIVLFSTVSYSLFQNKLMIQTTINNILNKQYFSPGIRNADNKRFAASLPQNKRNIYVKLFVNF